MIRVQVLAGVETHPHETDRYVDVADVVTFGHQLIDYRRWIDEYDVDLLVMNTKDEDQLAMHGLAYPLTVELRSTPLMLL